MKYKPYFPSLKCRRNKLAIRRFGHDSINTVALWCLQNISAHLFQLPDMTTSVSASGVQHFMFTFSAALVPKVFLGIFKKSLLKYYKP